MLNKYRDSNDVIITDSSTQTQAINEKVRQDMNDSKRTYDYE